jgi:tetratricopeptide (TPR) repeat protein
MVMLPCNLHNNQNLHRTFFNKQMREYGYSLVCSCCSLCITRLADMIPKGSVSELMGELDSATQAYERALSFNHASVQALLAISCILRSKDQFPAAVEYLKQIIRIEQNNGEVWSSLGLFTPFCFPT